MARLEIHSITPTGREERIDANFVELYTSVEAASASAANAASAVAVVSAAVTVLSGTVNDAWAAYTATATSQAGNITTKSTTAAQKAMGKTVHFTAACTITTIGTGSGSLNIDLPATANRATMVAGHSTGTVKACVGTIAAGATTALVVAGDGTFPAGSGQTVTIAGTYEKQ
jgi:hypothetical protein